MIARKLFMNSVFSNIKYFIKILPLLILLGLTQHISGQTVDEILKKDPEEHGFDQYIKIGIVVDEDSAEIEGDAKVLVNGKESGTIQGKYKLKAAGVDAIMVGNSIYYSEFIQFKPKFSFLSMGRKIFRGEIEVHNRGGENNCCKQAQH